MLDLSAGASLAAAVYRRTAGVGHSDLSRRAIEGAVSQEPQYELPSWTVFVVLGNIVLFLPIILVVSYTFKQVFPVLAMVENDKSEYEPVPLTTEDENSTTAPLADHGEDPDAPRLSLNNDPVTSSFRRTSQLLRANGGYKAYFRGFSCFLAIQMGTGFLYSVFSRAFAPVMASVVLLLVPLALVQVSAAWVHIVITPRSSAHFWQRMPPFRRAFDATALPTAILWLALQTSRIIPVALASILSLNLPDIDSPPGEPITIPAIGASDIWKGAIIAVFSITVALCLVVPAQVVLVRVQASLLPQSDDTIVAFDRSFCGVVTPAVVDGKGYATTADAWRTFTPAAWRRLLCLYVKIFLVNVAVMLGIVLVIAPQAYVVYRHSTLRQPSSGSS